MAYSKQDFITDQVLTAAQMDQVETNIADHIHGQSGVGKTFVHVSSADTTGGFLTDKITTHDGNALTRVNSGGNESLIVARLATGTYTGDGATSQGITGLGFQPKYVKIWKRATADATDAPLVETTDTIVDDNASGGAILHQVTTGGHTFEINMIISLDSDGFTVDDGGTNNFPNESGTVYNYMAMG